MTRRGQLDSIRWEDLTDARGEPPVEAPHALSVLASSKKPSERQAAFSDLYEILTHNGDYLHSIVEQVAPFLMDLLQSADTPDRGLVLLLLIECACGGTHRWFIGRGGFDAAHPRVTDEATRLRATLASQEATFRSLLAAKSKRTRAVAAHAIGFLPELPSGADLLRERLHKETDSATAAQILIALGRLGSSVDARSRAKDAVVKWAARFAQAHLDREQLERDEALAILQAAKKLTDELYPSISPTAMTAQLIASVAYHRGNADLLLAIARSGAIDPAPLVANAFALAFPRRAPADGPITREQRAPTQTTLLRALGGLLQEFTYAIPHIDDLGRRGVISDFHFRRLAGVDDGPAEANAPNGKPHWFNAWAMLYGSAPLAAFVDAIVKVEDVFAAVRDVCAYKLVYGWPPDYSVATAKRRALIETFGRSLRAVFEKVDTDTLAREVEVELERVGRHHMLAPLAAVAAMRGLTLTEHLERRAGDVVILGDHESIRYLLSALSSSRRETFLIAMGFDESVGTENGAAVVDFDGAWLFLEYGRTPKVLSALLSYLRTWNWDVLQLLRSSDNSAGVAVASYVAKQLSAFNATPALREALALWKHDADLAPQVKLLERALTAHGANSVT